MTNGKSGSSPGDAAGPNRDESPSRGIADASASLFLEAQRQPFLSRDRETELARQALTGDTAAAAELVTSHLRFVIRVARSYRSYGLPMNDLVQEGVVGLMQAVRKFNPDRNVRFATYAMWWIRAAIQDHVVRSWSLVRIGTTAAQKSLFFNLRRRMVELRDGADALSEELLAALAERFRMTLKDVASLAQRAGGHDHSLDQPVRGTIDDDGETWIERLADGRPTAEDDLAEDSEQTFWQTLLDRAMEMLSPREQIIIRERFLAEAVKTREALGRQLGISKERVRQLELDALDKLREILAPARSGASL